METITLEQMYYIGQTVSVVAVIASLIYVGKQLHQNTETMRVGSEDAYAQWSNGVLKEFGYDREFVKCWMKGDADFDNLDEIDKQRLLCYEWNAMNMWHYFFNLHRQKILPETEWRQLAWTIEYIGRRQAVRKAWSIFKDSYDKSFQNFMAQYMEE
jgi:hypothetical protein